MNRHVNAIAGRLSLRPPQRRLAGDSGPDHRDRAACERMPILASALDAIRSEFPTVTDFERDFPSSALRSLPASARRD